MAVSIADFLQGYERVETQDQKSFNGFSGLHGGLAEAMLVRQMRPLVPVDRALVGLSARFVRPLIWPIVLDAAVVRNGSPLTIASATASSEAGTSVEAHATFGVTAQRDIPVFAPEMPTDIVALADADRYVIPPEFVPISERMEIRAAVDVLPYSGAANPVLCGWVRLTDDVPSN